MDNNDNTPSNPQQREGLEAALRHMLCLEAGAEASGGDIPDAEAQGLGQTLAAAAAIAALLAAAPSAKADQDAWASRIAVQRNHNANLRGFQQFTQTLFDGMSGGGGNFNGGGGFNGGMQAPASAQVITSINNALVADMSPAFQRQYLMIIQQVVAQSVSNPQISVPLFQNTGNAFSNQRGDDNQRAATCCYLTAAAFMGLQPEQIQILLNSVAHSWDSEGQRWHRRGNFGLLLRQLGI